MALYGPKAGGAWGAGTSLAGPAGPAGSDGSNGADGREIQVRAGATHIEWRRTGDVDWTELVALAALTGPAGAAGAPGADGSDGVDGADGAPGSRMLTGVGEPDSGLGLDGDWYFDTAARELYGPKTGGAWAAGTSLVGDVGPVGPAGPQGPVGPTPLIVVRNLAPPVRVDGPDVVAATPQAYGIVFDDPDALRLWENPNGAYGSGGYLVPASVSLVDETGSGGRRFARVVSGAGTGYDHSALRLLTNLGDGAYRWLLRNAGTQPGASTSHGASVLVRQSMGAAEGTDDGYALGHIKYGGTDRTRIRRLVAGAATVLDGDDASPVFAHNQWYWAELMVSGTSLEGRCWIDGDARPTTPLLAATDATFSAADGHPAISFQGSATLAIDVAEFRFTPV
jgi:hypothetical protein